MTKKVKILREGGQESQLHAPFFESRPSTPYREHGLPARAPQAKCLRFPYNPDSPALINPVREPGEEAVAARVVLVSTKSDFQLLGRLLGAKQPPRRLWDCALRSGSWAAKPMAVAGPVLGAPYAAMVLEKLIALGAKAVIFLGWCGSLQNGLPVGSLVLPAAVLGEDGVSPHYQAGETDILPDPALRCALERFLSADLPEGISWRSGPVLTTDAYYRETAEMVQHYQHHGALAVDMELGALLAVGRFRGLPVAGLLAVSDELFSLSWRSGHRSSRLRQARETAARVSLAALAAWEEDHA
ncbi:MAG: nucleoside phosphorylase [Deltaproteobacteria bacterium]|nr:nucleoside phosphorylase [Deltaproteobacteria bacterium]